MFKPTLAGSLINNEKNNTIQTDNVFTQRNQNPKACQYSTAPCLRKYAKEQVNEKVYQKGSSQI